jgi:LysM repeat protein
MKARLLSVGILIALLLAGSSLPCEAADCSPVYHTVRVGQNLTQIARYYGVTVQAIAKANNLWNPNVIYVGQRLLIPVPCQKPPSTGCTLTHVVKRGEYLKIIAARYGTTVSVIVQLNRIKNPNLIYPGQRLKVPTSCKPTPPEPTPKPWKGEFWNNRDLSGDPKLSAQYSAVDFQWGTGGPKGVGTDSFSARFTRTQTFGGGTYLFHVKVDDGVRLWLDGQMLIDQWHDTAPAHYSVEKQIGAGDHKLKIEYYEHTGGAQIRFTVERLGPPPPPPSLPWKGEYFNNMNLQGNPAWTSQHHNIYFEWGNKSPHAGITANHFSARWTGTFTFEDGTYRFYATVDDGVRLFVDDQLILNEWHLASRKTYWVDRQMSAGTHKIRFEYYENTGDAVAIVWWVKR